MRRQQYLSERQVKRQTVVQITLRAPMCRAQTPCQQAKNELGSGHKPVAFAILDTHLSLWKCAER